MALIRIRSTEETKRLGLAAEIGVDFGFTTPSVTGVDVIGANSKDYAVSVFFERTGQQLWFSEDVLEYVDHDPGLEATIDGKRMFYNGGRWDEIP